MNAPASFPVGVEVAGLISRLRLHDKSGAKYEIEVRIFRIIGCDGGRFPDFALIAIGVFDCKLDLSLLTRRHDFVKVAFGASSTGSDVLN